MRKILLGTTAVVGAALLAPGAFAQPAPTQVPAGGGAATAGQAPLVPSGAGTGGIAVQPTPAIAGAGGLTVRLGGYFNFAGGYVQDDYDYARSRNSREGINNSNARQRQDFRNDAELNVFVDGRASNGMTYGAVFEFQMDNVNQNGGGGDGTTVSMDELYGFITLPNLGTLRFGQEDSAASLLQIRAPGSAGLGADGEWDEFIVQTGLFGSPYLIAGINDGGDATKIVYLSPQFAGFDFGLSYAANSFEGERTDQPTSPGAQRDRTGFENQVTAAIRYRGTFGAIGVQAGVGAVFASPQALNAAGVAFGAIGNPRPQNINAYTVGASITAYGFGFGAEYTFGEYNGSGPGNTALNAGLDGSQHYAIGLTYTMGPLVVGGTFGQAFQSNGVQLVSGVNGGTGARAPVFRELDDRTHTIWGIGAAYNLAPGLVLYGTYTAVNDENVPISAPSNARYTSGSGTTLASFNGSNTRTINIGVVGIRLAF